MEWVLFAVFVGLFSGCLCLSPLEDDDSLVLRVAPPSNNTTPSVPVTNVPTHPPLVISKHYVTKDGQLWTSKPGNQSSVRIEATNLVPALAITKASHTIGHMLKDAPQEVFEAVARSNGVRIFPSSHGMTVYPEMAMHRDSPHCHGKCTGDCHVTCAGGHRKFSHIAGLTGAYSYVSDKNILCMKGDGYYGHLNVLGHEFSHLIMFHLPGFWKNKINAAYNHAKTHKTWLIHSYGMSNHNEYWAEASGAFLRFTHMPTTTGGMIQCGHKGHTLCQSLTEARNFLKEKDPQLYAVLDYVYTNNRPELDQKLKPCM